MQSHSAISRYLIQHAYRLENSSRYQAIKRAAYNLLENPRSRSKAWFDVFMVMLVISSVILLIFDVRNDIGFWGEAFEDLVVTVFIIEYLLRMWLWNDNRKIFIEQFERAELLGRRFSLWPSLRAVLGAKWDYMRTPMAVIDLLAIIPSYRPFRILRLFLLFRVFKLFRYARSVNEFARILAEKRFELSTLALFVGFIVFSSATAIYVFEGDRAGSHIHSFFDAVYWSLVTLSTVGYGDMVPVSHEGRIVTLLLIASGLGVLAFATSIIVAAFTEKLTLLREQRIWSIIERHRDQTVIFGYGRIGEMLARKLEREHEQLVILDKRHDRIVEAQAQGHTAIEADVSHSDVLQQGALIEEAKTLICASNDDRANVFATLTARHLNPNIQIIARALSPGVKSKLLLAGANYVVESFDMIGMVAAQAAGHPVAFEALHGIMGSEHKRDVDAVRLPDQSALIDMSLGEIDFSAEGLVLFGVILVHGGADIDNAEQAGIALGNSHFHFNPPDHFRLRAGHILVVLGHRENIARFHDRVENDQLRGRSRP